MMISCGPRYVPAIAALCGVLSVSATSEAHFILTSPAASTAQSVLGDPQKAPPCGDDGTAVATGTVTTFQPGETITVTIDETIFHPGHYRIALAVNSPDELPAEPPVTAANTACGSAPIDPQPVFPVLADGVFEHTQPFTEPQSIQITLPDDVTCDNCTLQVIQFMSNHGLNNPGGCYYHHCAGIAMDAGASGDTMGATDGGGPSTDDGATTAPGATSETPADGTAGAGDDTNDTSDGDDAAGTSAGSGNVDTDPGQAPADGAADSGCSCALPNRGNPPPFALLLGLLGIVGLRVRRSRRASV